MKLELPVHMVYDLHLPEKKMRLFDPLIKPDGYVSLPASIILGQNLLNTMHTFVLKSKPAGLLDAFQPILGYI